MMSNSDAGKELNTDELSFRSKRLPEKETVRGLGVSLMCQQSLAALSVLIFTALAQVNNQPAQHLLWPALWLFVCLLIFNTFPVSSVITIWYITQAASPDYQVYALSHTVILIAFSVSHIHGGHFASIYERSYDDELHRSSLILKVSILFTAGAEVVVCCLRSCLGLAVTSGNCFKMDSLSACFRSMGLSEDREQEEERSVLHPHHLTHSHTQL